jgi:hypothetical protein
MKFNYFKNAIIALMVLFFAGNILVSCGDDDDDKNSADKTALNALIAECEQLANDANTDDYPQSAIDAFKTVINTVKTASENANITQEQVNNLVTQLNQAKTVFLDAAYEDIPAAALLIGLGFDEDQGTELTAQGKNLKAVLKTGPAEIFGANAGLPTFVAGQKGQALNFNYGSHVTIDAYSANDFLGKKLSIAVWVKPTDTRPGNYILSFNSWDTWKFQLQEDNKPFFTVHTDAGWTDADNEAAQSAPNGSWTHLVVVMDLENETLDFYTNGILAKQWTSSTKTDFKGTPVGPVNPVPIIIGARVLFQSGDNFEDWFNGAMDELKVYNIALSQGQVTRLYETEK